MEGLSVIIPIYNEKESIKKTIEDLAASLKNAKFEHEIILVDDCSVDGTREYLKNQKYSDNIKALFHNKNKGYGASLKTGIKNSKHENIFIADCDGTYPIESIPEMAEPLVEKKCDMIIGARIGKDSQIPLIRRPAKFIIQALANYLTGEKIPDLNSGFRGIKKAAVMRFMPILPNGFSFTTTITIAMLSNEYEVVFREISYKKRLGKSKINPIKDTANFFQLIIRTVLYFDPLKIFVPVFFIIVGIAAAIFGYTYFAMDKMYDNTVTILLLAAFQILAIGLIADLIDKRMK